MYFLLVFTKIKVVWFILLYSYYKRNYRSIIFCLFFYFLDIIISTIN